MEKRIRITGLSCAGCAAELEEILNKIEGVREASVSFVEQSILVDLENGEALEKVKAAANGFEEVRVLEDGQTDGETVLRLANLHCAACALDLEEILAKIKGVERVSVDFLTQTIRLKAKDGETVRRVIKTAGKFEKVKVLNGDEVAPVKESRLRAILEIVLSASAFLVAFLLSHFGKGRGAEVLSIVLFFAAYVTVGYPVLLSTAKNVAKGRVFDENFLMTIASIGAFALGQFDEGVLVMLLYQIGELLQSVAVGSSRRSVKSLLEIKSEFARKIDEAGKEITVAPETLVVGDRLVVKAGEKVAVDGVLCSTTATLDTKYLTGEAEPREVKEGDTVLSGTLNAGGVFEMRVEKPYEDSAVKKILELVENASSKKAAPEKFITKFARFYTPIVCIFALAIVAFAPLIELWTTGGAYLSHLVSWVTPALNFLVISCPCALIISVPLTYFSGIGSCAREGILVKGATYLDVLARVKTAAFDKTGTLTEGNFTIRAAYPAEGVTEEELFKITAAAEKGSSHPIAKAFEGMETPYTAVDVEEISGKGITATLDGKELLVGNASLMKKYGFTPVHTEEGLTAIYVVLDGQYLGAIGIGDTVRSDAHETIEALKGLGVERVVMLTGDTESRAWRIANGLGIYEVNAELMPDKKLAVAEELKKDGALVYVGDGINDAPVMATSDCAISMGKLGSAAAVEASDLVLVSDKLSGVVKAVKTAKKTKRIVVENIVFSVVAKLVFMGFSLAGALPLSVAVLADVGVMLLAVLNSMRMRRRIKS